MTSASVVNSTVPLTQKSSESEKFAEKQTSSAAKISKKPSSNVQSTNSRPSSGKPNPVREAFNSKIDKITYEITNVSKKLSDIQLKIDGLHSGGSATGDSASDPVFAIREKKKTIFNLVEKSKAALEKSKSLRQTMDSKMKVFQDAKALDAAIKRIDDQLNSSNGTHLTLLEEKKLLNEQSKLIRQQKVLEKEIGSLAAADANMEVHRKAYDEAQATITETNVAISKLRLEVDQLGEKLKVAESARHGKSTQISALIEERKTLKAKMDVLYTEKKEAFEAFRKQAAQNRLAFEREKMRREIAAKKQEFFDEIETLTEKLAKIEFESDQNKAIAECDGLVISLNQLKNTSATLPADKIADDNHVIDNEKLPAGMVVFERKNVEFIPRNTASSKKKVSGSAHSSSWKLPIHVVSGLSSLGLTIPLSVADIDPLIQALQQKKLELADAHSKRKDTVEEEKRVINDKIKACHEKINEIDQEIKEKTAAIVAEPLTQQK